MTSLKKASEILKHGGIVIFPTETVFGIGCRVGDNKAIKRLYEIKKRKMGKPTHILAKDFSQAEKYGLFNESAKKLAKNFWPGPLTLVVTAKNSVPKIIKSNNNTIGIRVSKHKVVHELVSLVGEPILAPSANFTDLPAPNKLSKIDKKLRNLVDYVLEFDCGNTKPSTIIEIVDSKYHILREGSINKKELNDG